jgi:hypothetical protein
MLEFGGLPPWGVFPSTVRRLPTYDAGAQRFRILTSPVYGFGAITGKMNRRRSLLRKIWHEPNQNAYER